MLKSALDSLASATEAVKKSESLLEGLILDFNADDSSDSDSEASEQENESETVAEYGEFCFPGFIGFDVVDATQRKLIQFQQFDNAMHEALHLPLQWQLNDIYCLLAPINRRTELLQKLADAVEEREKASKELASAPPHKSRQKQERLDKVCAEIDELKQKIASLDANLQAQLPLWTRLSTELLFNELDGFK